MSLVLKAEMPSTFVTALKIAVALLGTSQAEEIRLRAV